MIAETQNQVCVEDSHYY